MQLFGKKPNQIPTNADLGGMAYLDPKVALPLGVMPLVGGAPIVESGTTANGDFIRFADGSQICYRVSLSTVSGGTTWTYPAAFSEAPAVIALERDTTQARVYTANPLALTSTVRAYGVSGSAVAGLCQVIAIGRWK